MRLLLLCLAVLAILLTASRPLVCYTVKLSNTGIVFKQVPCRSTEFTGKPEPIQPTARPTATAYPVYTPEPTATEFVFEPTATLEPCPVPTIEPYPALEVWGGIEPTNSWWK